MCCCYCHFRNCELTTVNCELACTNSGTVWNLTAPHRLLRNCGKKYATVRTIQDMFRVCGLQFAEPHDAMYTVKTAIFYLWLNSPDTHSKYGSAQYRMELFSTMHHLNGPQCAINQSAEHSILTCTVASPCLLSSCCSSSSVVCLLICPIHSVRLHTETHRRDVISFTKYLHLTTDNLSPQLAT